MQRHEAKALLEMTLDTAHPSARELIEDVLGEWERRHGFEPQPRPKARRGDRDTAQRAAEANAFRATGQRLRLLVELQLSASHAGATAEALANRTGIPLNSASTRLSEMERAGWVACREGETRKTSAGASASVYRITDEGRRALTTRR